MVLPILHDDNPGSNHPEESDASLGIDDYDWIPSRTLADAINLGVSRPWRTFVIPSLPPRWPGVQSASVGFTADGAVVFGLQVEGVGAAKELLEQLLADFSWSIALMSELRSPSSEADALAMAKNEKTFLYRLHDVEGPA
jgi:hypothetical protein